MLRHQLAYHSGPLRRVRDERFSVVIDMRLCEGINESRLPSVKRMTIKYDMRIESSETHNVLLLPCECQ